MVKPYSEKKIWLRISGKRMASLPALPPQLKRDHAVYITTSCVSQKLSGAAWPHGKKPTLFLSCLFSPSSSSSVPHTERTMWSYFGAERFEWERNSRNSRATWGFHSGGLYVNSCMARFHSRTSRNGRIKKISKKDEQIFPQSVWSVCALVLSMVVSVWDWFVPGVDDVWC